MVVSHPALRDAVRCGADRRRNVVNDWINPAGGDWDTASNWTYGVPVAGQQSAPLTGNNSCARAVEAPISDPNDGAICDQHAPMLEDLRTIKQPHITDE